MEGLAGQVFSDVMMTLGLAGEEPVPAVTSSLASLPPRLGLALLVICLAQLLVLLQAGLVHWTRLRHSIPVTTVYSDAWPVFNRYQAIHRATLERIPQFYSLLLLSCLLHPLAASVLGLAWLLARLLYLLAWHLAPALRFLGSAVTLAAEVALLSMVATTAVLLLQGRLA
jgi:glutathione S-transferase